MYFVRTVCVIGEVTDDSLVKERPCHVMDMHAALFKRSCTKRLKHIFNNKYIYVLLGTPGPPEEKMKRVTSPGQAFYSAIFRLES